MPRPRLRMGSLRMVRKSIPGGARIIKYFKRKPKKVKKAKTKNAKRVKRPKKGK